MDGCICATKAVQKHSAVNKKSEIKKKNYYTLKTTKNKPEVLFCWKSTSTKFRQD